jgi:hypothetical protein
VLLPTVIAGEGLTVTTTVLDVVPQPVDVPVTVYVEVTLGEAVTEAPVVALRPVDGDHE